ncbi:hypothetical protein [Helicobacter sp. 16-1353]|nr:hypothetical protein [Helicobacter sp. 16-1353]
MAKNRLLEIHKNIAIKKSKLAIKAGESRFAKSKAIKESVKDDVPSLF